MARLPENDREVLVIRDLEHLKFGKIAAVLGIAGNSVKVRHFRADERLRGAMARLDEREPSR